MYKISKSYEDTPSRNEPTYYNGMIYLDTAVKCLDNIATHWISLGGSIVSKTRDELIVAEANGENRITFKIEEE